MIFKLSEYAKKILYPLSMIIMIISSCDNAGQNQQSQNTDLNSFQHGSFGCDLHFLQQYDSVVVLKDYPGNARIIVSPKYQAKVFTLTADGNGGISFGWVNYKAFAATPDPHMNAYGGENSLWLGPE